MTVSSTSRVAGPYAGNGVATEFAFTFKVFRTSDLKVIKHNLDTGVDSVLVLTTDYAVTLSANQDSNPGGTVTVVSAPTSDYTITIVSNVPYTQNLAVTNQGGFYPDVINDAFDKTVIQLQQVLLVQNRSIRFPLSDGMLSEDGVLPPKDIRAGCLMAFDMDGKATVISSINGITDPKTEHEGGGGESVVIGSGALSEGTQSISIGNNSSSGGTGSVAIGETTVASGNWSVAAGSDAVASAVDAVAIGDTSNASGDYSIAIGVEAVASDEKAVAVGPYSKATVGWAAAFGAGAEATDDSATAIGNYSYSTYPYATCVGSNAGAFDSYATAIGPLTFADYAYSTAIGAKAYTASIGKISFSNGTISALGDSQYGVYILRKSTTDASATVLTTDGNAPGLKNLITLPNNGGYAIRGLVIGRRSRSTGDEAVMFEFTALATRGVAALNTSVIGIPVISKPYASAGLSTCTLTVTADTTNGGVALTVGGVAGTNIRWVATVHCTECVYA